MIPVLSLDMEDPFEFIDRYGSFDYVKVGHNLACSGKQVLGELEKRNLKAILDLKFADIPSTVARSIRSWDHPCIAGFTVHAAAGVDSLKAALESTDKIVFAVVKLTSVEGELEDYLDQINSIKILGCSFVLPGKWAMKLRKQIPAKILVAGIRMLRQADDQRDVVNLEDILQVADYAVIGREVYRSVDPSEAMERIRRIVYA